MVNVPLIGLLGLFIWISLTRGKGKGAPLFGVLCLMAGMFVANTQAGGLLLGLVTDTVQTFTGAL